MANYYVQRSGKKFGPFNTAQLKELATKGKITRDDAVSADQQRWTPAGNVKGLFPPAELIAPPHTAEPLAPIETVVDFDPLSSTVPRAIPRAVPAQQQPTIVYVQAPAAPAAAQPQQVIQQTTVVIGAQRQGNTCAAVAALFGLLALVASFVPFLGLVVIPAAALTLLIALVGFVVALTRGGTGPVGSIGGGLLALVAIPIALATTAAGASAVNQSVQEAQQRAQQEPSSPR